MKGFIEPTAINYQLFICMRQLLKKNTAKDKEIGLAIADSLIHNDPGIKRSFRRG